MWFQPKTPAIRRAWNAIKRADFIPEDSRRYAHLDQPISIGQGQTISQPSVVAFMLEELQPRPGGRYLDVGFGSGWTTALLAHIAGPKGRVWAIEINPELKKFGENNINRYNFIEQGRVNCILGDGSQGYGPEAPFDGILVSASAQEIPERLKEQLVPGGRMVIPVGQSVYRIIRQEDSGYQVKEFPGFLFVPLLSHGE